MMRHEAAPAWLLATVGLAVLLGVFFRFYHLDGKVFWEDEILGAIHTLGNTEAEVVEASPRLQTAAAVQRYLRPAAGAERRPLAATVRSLASEDPQHPPLYYLAAHLWTQSFGGSAAAYRSLAAVFGVLALPCLYWLCIELFPASQTALFAVALVSVSPFYVLYAQEAREYSLWTVAILLSALVFLRATRSSAVAPWIAYAALMALALYVYPLSGLVALGFFAYLFVRERCRLTRKVQRCAVATLAAVAAFAPWMKVMVSSHGLERGMSGIMTQKLSPIAIGLIFARNLRIAFFDLGAFRIGPLSSSILNLALTVVVVALIAYALVHLVRRRPFAVWGFVIVALCLPMTLLLLQDLLVRGRFVYQARYFIPLFIGVQLAVAELFGAKIFGRAPGGVATRAWLALFAVVLAGGVLSCAIASGASTWWNKDYERARSVAEIVNHSAKPVVISDYFTPSILALGFYLDPGVALHLNLKCAQCAASPAAGSDHPGDLTGYDTVFALQLADSPNPGRSRWIDPLPFPARVRPLNMFLSI
jgi:uncharacterized membrane protein